MNSTSVADAREHLAKMELAHSAAIAEYADNPTEYNEDIVVSAYAKVLYAQTLVHALERMGDQWK